MIPGRKSFFRDEGEKRIQAKVFIPTPTSSKSNWKGNIYTQNKKKGECAILLINLDHQIDSFHLT